MDSAVYRTQRNPLGILSITPVTECLILFTL